MERLAVCVCVRLCDTATGIIVAGIRTEWENVHFENGNEICKRFVCFVPKK